MTGFPDPEEWAANGYIPTRHQLRAAQVVSSILDDKPVPIARVRRSYPHLPSDGVFDHDDFLVGEALLTLAGLASTDETHIHSTIATGAGPAPLKVILLGYLERQVPPWVGAATTYGHVDWTRVPEEAKGGFEALFQDSYEREAVLLQIARTFDDRLLKEIGEAGEVFVAESWRHGLAVNGCAHLAPAVERLSEISDQLGYDLRAPALDGSTRRVEVKTTVAQESFFRMVLSRNEAVVGLSDLNWRLVACRKTGAEIAVIGWCKAETIRPYFPTNVEAGSRWLTVEIELPVEMLTPDLPLH